MEQESIHLLERFRNGDEEAAEELFERFANRLIALARSRISGKLARRVDAEDVVQSVYNSFFRRAKAGEYEIQRRGDMWRLLASITIHKVLSQAEHYRQQKRSLDKEQSVHLVTGGPAVRLEVLARDPSPSDAAAIVEELELVMSQILPLHRQILELRLQGWTIPEISEHVRRSERSVRRALQNVREALEKRLVEFNQ